MNISGFEFGFRYAFACDKGRVRESNQDRAVVVPERGVFGVSDGMGGLLLGEQSAEYVAQAIPAMIESVAGDVSADNVPAVFSGCVSAVSDRLFETGNKGGYFNCGATFAGVWLSGSRAVFAWLGDSRGYVLPRYRKKIVQITEDMNIAGLLVARGEITREEARDHPGSSKLTAFVGMQSPAEPETGSAELHRGDRILLCSDGLYGMVDEKDIVRIMRSSKNPDTVCRRLVDRANENGGCDNISAVYIKII